MAVGEYRMNPHGTRTREAVAWLLEQPAQGEPKRTQARAAELFGISQPTIAGAVARTRRACPTCGQKVREGVELARPAVPHPSEESETRLAGAIGKYAWHLADCAAYDTGGGECSCGFADIERIAARVAA